MAHKWPTKKHEIVLGAADLKSASCGFESRAGYFFSRKIDNLHFHAGSGRTGHDQNSSRRRIAVCSRRDRSNEFQSLPESVSFVSEC